MQSRCSPLTSLINTGCFHFSHHSVQTLEAFVLGGGIPENHHFQKYPRETEFQCHVLFYCHVNGSLRNCMNGQLFLLKWYIVSVCVLIVELCARAQNKPWLVINASHISHLVLVCEAVGSTWEMFNGFGFLEEKKKHYSKKLKEFFETDQTRHGEPLSDNRISRWCLGKKQHGWHDQKWIPNEAPNGSNFRFSLICSLIPFRFVTPVYLYLTCTHSVINNEERHWVVLIFSAHIPLPSFFFFESLELWRLQTV